MKSNFKKYLAALLAVIMMIGVIPLSVLGDDSTKYTDYLDGWTVKVLWSTMQNDYEWNATLDEERQPRIFVTLYNANVGADEDTHSPDEIAYDVGSLKLTIPGVGGAVRRLTVIASDIAAGSDEEGNRWSYEWDEATDTYTFTNNFPIYYQQSVNGGFEFLWTFNARDNTDGFEKVIEPKFSVEGKGEINIEPLTYKFTSEPDYYRTYIYTPTPLSHDMAEQLSKDFIWYNVRTRIDMDKLARALYSSSYFFTFEHLPDGIKASDINVVDNSGKKIDIIEKGGKIGFYLFKEKMGEIKGDYYFNVGFNREALTGDDRTVELHGHLDRQYYDHQDWWTEKTRENDIVDVDIKFTVEDYKFDYHGLIYHMCKEGPYSYKNLGKSAPSKYSERYNVQNLYRNGVVVFTLHGQANRDYAAAYSISDIAINGAVPYAEESNDSLSRIKEDQEWSMILGDDTLIILQEDTSIRCLEDDEYDFDYVIVPKKQKGTNDGYDFDVYVATTQNAKYEEYTKYEQGSGNTKEQTTVKLPAGTKAFYIRFNGIVGSFNHTIRPAVRMHLDYAKDQASGNPINPEAYFANFGYIRAMYWDDEENAECDDIRIGRNNYGGSYADQLAAQDQERYGQYLWHDYANVYLRNPVTNLETKINLDEFNRSADRTRFETTISATGTIKGDEQGSLEKFSMYIALPQGVHVDVDKLFTVAGSGFTIDGARISGADFAGHAKIRVEERNGVEMVFIDFDFSDMPIEISETTQINVDFSGYLTYADYQEYGSKYTAYSYVGVHDVGTEKITGSYIVADQYDFDDDGSQTDLLARSESIQQIAYAAQQWSERVTKYVASAYSDGYTTNTVVKRYANGVDDKDQPGSFYTYRLDFEIGANMASDVWFYDALEQGADISVAGNSGDTIKHIDSEWQGTFLSVDASYVESLGAVATVYYSTDPKQELARDASGWTKLTDSTDRTTIRAIAVALDTSGMETGGFMAPDTGYAYIIINMKAPDSQDYDNTTAVNQFTVRYTGTSANDVEERTSLPSNETYLTLQETVGGFTIRKVDKDNGAALTGAEFAVYDRETGGKLIKEGTVNSLGQFVVSNIPYGKYYWEETKAPEGYKKIEGRHEVIVGGETVIFVDAENERIPGSVILTKIDGTNSDYGILSGAEFELYRSGGNQLYANGADGKYTYNENGSVGTFVTGDDGTITVSNLPWGSYYFIETKAPDGYELSSRTVAFTIGKAQYDADTDTIVVNVEAQNEETLSHIRLVKTDSKSGEAIQGAVFSLYRVVEDGEDYLVASGLQTDFKGLIEYEGDLPFGKYYFVETRNASGYKLPAETKTDTVTIDATNAGATLQINFENDPISGSVELMKTDDFGQTVDGAEYALYLKTSDEEEIFIGTYTTQDGGFIRVGELEWGDYYFVEETAPRGYELSDERIEFTVDKTTVTNTIYVYAQDYRQRGSIKLLKMDKANNAVLLEGAEYELYSTAGVLQIAGKDYTTDRDDNKIITGADGSITISGIRQGGYYLKEIVAPSGYSISSEFIRFSIGTETAGVVQTIRAEDEKGKAIIVVNKSINTVYEAFGNPTFIFTVTNDTTGQVFTKSITLSELQLTGSVIFEVDADYTYTVREYISARYGLVDITNNENITDINVADGTAKADLTDGKNRAEVTYRNEIEQYEKLSQSTNVTNIVKSRAKLTAITVDYIGPNPINNDNVSGLKGYNPNTKVYTFQAEDLIVKAQYDDGSSRELTLGRVLTLGMFTIDKYTINRNTADTSVTIIVTYRENGITVTGAFTVEIESPIGDLHKVTLNTDGGRLDADTANGWGGTDGTTAVVRQNIQPGSTLTLPEAEPTKDGYFFAEWADDRGYTYAPGAQITVNEDITITARYIAAYTVTLDPGAGEWGDSTPDSSWENIGSGRYRKSTTASTGATVELPECNPERDGDYYFYAWEDANGKLYKDSYTPAAGSTAKDITLTAHYADYTVKYAVSIYGINHDQDENGETLGLTFGPATGKVRYANNYAAHAPKFDPANPCIHWMTWEEIIDQSLKDPTVFQTCLDKRCTTSVKLIMSGPIAGTLVDDPTSRNTGSDANTTGNYYTYMPGDGAGTLRSSIVFSYRFWNPTNTNAGGWPASKMRNTLNGTPTENGSLTEEEALIAMFPQVLQENIVAKAVDSEPIHNQADYVTTYDKLWLLSLSEFVGDRTGLMSTGDDLATHYRNNEGALYSRQQDMSVLTIADNVMRLEEGDVGQTWFRSVTNGAPGSAYGFKSDGYHRYNTGTKNCVAPCFCIR